ncbi:Uncharacterised protein [Porphyromonas crevioricanis]|uniref:Uncharacterized protein n=1 Tax=Porphyromonas crevioricanis TaxID=393921 RepID=A0A2X4SGA2_9PORP|nr:ABC-three component system middle component 1 [Porphyromonas crevioricanis]GAD07115.1 hypothetical protein PORCAN_732 [Porphyromonas crevioricanis JCM 13913]SQH73042.1 Uncharacterised protein [Porphyromonas crevioricanis]
MNEFIIELFEQFKYQPLNESDGVGFIKHAEHKDFWAIVNAVEIFNLESQEGIAEIARTIFAQDKEAEKNTSLLILLQVEKISEEVLDAIVEIENDPFYFKKYVLAYTDRSARAIVEYSVEDFSSILMKAGNFDALKNEIDISGPYHLLYSTAHKLPFIMASVQAQNSATLYSNQYTPSKELEEAFNWLQSIDLQAEDLAKEVACKLDDLITKP